MRALLLKPVAIAAAMGLALFGVALLAFSAFIVHSPAAAAQSSDCGSPPSSSVVIPAAAKQVGGGGSSVNSAAVASVSDSPSPTATPAYSVTLSTTSVIGSSSGTGQTSVSPTDTPSSSPSPTPTPSPSPTPDLCVEVQPYPSSGDVLAGDPASFVVWVWSLTADSSDVAVAVAVPAASYLGSPDFTIPPVSGNTYTLVSLPVGDVGELLASVPTTSAAPLGTDIQLTATATETGASTGSASGDDEILSPAAISSGGSSTSTGSLSTVPPLISLPPIPGTGVTATNPADLFPTVTPGTGSLGLPSATGHRTVRAAETAYAVPVDARLLGAQIVGFVALACAVTIAVLRLSVRKPQPATPLPAEPTDTTAAS